MALPGISRFQNRVALVTGASVGIGEAICDTLVRHGMIVIGCARHTEAIVEHAKKLEAEGFEKKLYAVQCDVGKEDEIELMFDWIAKTLGGVDVCINNAAFPVSETLLESDAKKLRRMFDVNVIGLIMCTKLAIKSMQARGVDDGHIIQVNAVLGHEIRGFLNAYAASKCTVTALTQGFKKELNMLKSNIRMTSLSPGMVKTRFLYSMHTPEEAEEMYQIHPHIHAEDVANAVLHVLSQPANVNVHEYTFESVRA